ELKIPENLDIETIEKTLENNLINSDLEVKNIREQHSDVLSFVELERWFIIFIFILIILLAAFNLIGSLSIIIIDKKDNLKTLHHLGLSRKKIQQIFWNLNYQMNALGVGIGLSLGILICVLQQEFQLIRIAPSLAYPVKMQFTDGLMICLIVAILSSICAFFSIRKIKISNL
ncbi:MAG: FtsX-like permease family protein, partial [Flavobacteriales bacterium]